MQGATGDLRAKCRVPANPVPAPLCQPLLISGGHRIGPLVRLRETPQTYWLKQHKFVVSA